MKYLLLSLIFFPFGLFAQESNENFKSKINKVVVDAGCGKCCFKSKGMKKCNLAVKIDGKVYHVEGRRLRDFGKPRAKHGLCREIRKAEVSGEIVNNNFLAYDFKILPIIKEEMQLIKEEQSPQIDNKL